MTWLRCTPLSDNDLNKRGIIRFGDDIKNHLPPGAIGGSTLHEFASDPVNFYWGEQSSQVDMPRNAEGTALRWFFRPKKPGFLKRFLVEAGCEIKDVILLEEIGPRGFRLHVEKADGEKERIKRWSLRDTRPGQAKFRQGVAERDGLKCGISGCEVPAVLDAAHLDPHADGGSSDPSNGMILRTDIHRLFDAGLLVLDQAGKITVKPEVTDPDYRRFDGCHASTTADLRSLLSRAT